MYTIKGTSLYTLLIVSFLATGCLGKLREEVSETMQQVRKTAKTLEKEVEKLNQELKKLTTELKKVNKRVENPTSK